MNGNRTRTQADKPFPPRERPAGQFWMDCEPHRGSLLFWMGAASVFIGLFSIPVVLLAPLEVPLGLTTWWLARRDLTKMRKGLMDPTGREVTDFARKCGLTGLLLGVLAVAILAVMVLSVLV